MEHIIAYRSLEILPKIHFCVNHKNDKREKGGVTSRSSPSAACRRNLSEHFMPFTGFGSRCEIVRLMIRESSRPSEKLAHPAAGLRLSAGFPPAFRQAVWSVWRKAVSSYNMTIPRTDPFPSGSVGGTPTDATGTVALPKCHPPATLWKGCSAPSFSI